MPNPHPATPHATNSPVEAALTGKILDEEPLPSDGEVLTEADAEDLTEAEDLDDLRALDGEEAAELEAEIQAEDEPGLWDDEPKVDNSGEPEVKKPVPEPKL